MTYWDRKLVREQLDQTLGRFRDLVTVKLDNQWIKVIREALGMTASQLANRVGVDQSRISRLERAEARGELKLSTLKKIAEGLNMTFVYGFVPNSSMENMVREQAKKITLKKFQNLNHSMSLEEQELSGAEKQRALENMIQKIMIEEPKDFWDNEID